MTLNDIHTLHAQFITRSTTCPVCYQLRTECEEQHQ
jgi:hypothetical protein